MVKNEFITKVQDKIELEVSKKDLNAIFDGMVAVIKDAVIAGDTVTIPEICKSGITKLGGVEKPWSKPAHKEGCVKAVKSLKDIFE